MVGNPKYNIGDKVKFKFEEEGKKYMLIGEVYIVDKYGVFGDGTSVYYDIMVKDTQEQHTIVYPCLIKHLKEDNLELVGD